MERPTETPRDAPTILTDEEAPDWLEARAVALLAFLDSTEPREFDLMRDRLAMLFAKVADARLGAAIIDLAHHRLVADALHVKAAPMVVVFHDGEVVDRVLGAPPVHVLEDVVRTRLRTARA